MSTKFNIYMMLSNIAMAKKFVFFFLMNLVLKGFNIDFHLMLSRDCWSYGRYGTAAYS